MEREQRVSLGQNSNCDSKVLKGTNLAFAVCF